MQNVSKTTKTSRKGKTFFPFNTTQNENKKILMSHSSISEEKKK